MARKKPHRDTNGIPLPIDYNQIKTKDDLVFQTKPRKKYYDKIIATSLLLELATKHYMKDNAFRVFCYMGSKIVWGNISYINGHELMDAVGIKRSMYSVSLNELIKKGFVREMRTVNGFVPKCKSDRIFLLSPAYLWKGYEVDRMKGVKEWYLR